MAVITSGKTFANGEQLSADKLNQVITLATFNASDAVDGSTMTLIGGAMAIQDLGVVTAKIADSNVTTAKIADSNVTKAKIENLANMTVLGNTSGSSAAPQEVSILDEDTMSSDSATSLATQQSIKAYANGTLSAATNGYVKLPNGLIMQWGEHTDADIAHGEDFSVSFPLTFPTALLQIKGQPNDNALSVTSSSMASVQRIISSSTSGFTAEVGNVAGSAMNMTYKWNAIGH